MSWMHLFVYGTLMAHAAGRLGAAERARLAGEAARLGEATLAGGRLIDLGRYPGLLLDGGDGLVHGEVWRIADVATLHWLDAYEGITQDATSVTPPDDYVRVSRTVRLADGVDLDAWVYVLTAEPGHARPIPSGRWQAADAAS